MTLAYEHNAHSEIQTGGVASLLLLPILELFMATLLDIREKFVEFSGRFDLATPVNVWTTDAGADWFINAGLEYLDGEQEHPQTSKVWVQTLSAGTSQVAITEARAIREVWLTDDATSTDWLELKKTDLDTLLTDFPDLAATTRGVPSVWCPGITRDAPNSPVTGGAAAGATVINIQAPPLIDYVMQAFGDFKTAEMTTNTDTNWWTIHHAHVVVLAAMRTLEGIYRNTAGMLDYERQIETLLRGVDKDLVNVGMPENEDMSMRG